MGSGSTELTPFYEQSQSIYDLSHDFFALFLGPTMGYTCAYFERDDMTLEEAQVAKFDLALGGPLAKVPTTRSFDVRIGAFEALTKKRYRTFFESAHRALASDGRMLLHTILTHPPSYWAPHGIAITMSDLRFMRFIGREIFPGGELPSEDDVVAFATGAGFGVERVHRFRPHYARRDAAIAITSEVNYDRFLRYLTGCADFFRRGITEVGQFTS